MALESRGTGANLISSAVSGVKASLAMAWESRSTGAALIPSAASGVMESVAMKVESRCNGEALVSRGDDCVGTNGDGIDDGGLGVWEQETM